MKMLWLSKRNNAIYNCYNAFPRRYWWLPMRTCIITHTLWTFLYTVYPSAGAWRFAIKTFLTIFSTNSDSNDHIAHTSLLAFIWIRYVPTCTQITMWQICPFLCSSNKLVICYLGTWIKMFNLFLALLYKVNLECFFLY